MNQKERDTLEGLELPFTFNNHLLIDNKGEPVCRITPLAWGLGSETFGRMIADAFNAKYRKENVV